MIIYKNIDSLWINTIHGVTVYFSYNHLFGCMSGYINTPCGVPQVQTFGKCESVKDGRNQLSKLTQLDANALFEQIKSWESNVNTGVDYFISSSISNPVQLSPCNPNGKCNSSSACRTINCQFKQKQ